MDVVGECDPTEVLFDHSVEREVVDVGEVVLDGNTEAVREFVTSCDKDALVFEPLRSDDSDFVGDALEDIESDGETDALFDGDRASESDGVPIDGELVPVASCECDGVALGENETMVLVGSFELE